MKKSIMTNKAPMPAGSYSQAILTENLVFVAGQGPLDPATKTVPTTVSEQTRQVLTNIKNILLEAGSSMDKVVKVSVFLSDIKYFNEFNKVYEEFFNEPFPVRTTVGAQLNNIDVEIDVIALKN
jgi:2-iminobutanoate/2-iminopropanoate deaminase